MGTCSRVRLFRPCVVSLLLTATMTLSVLSQDIDVSRIRSQLREHRTSIVSLDIEYTLRTPPRELVTPDSQRTVTEAWSSRWEWARDGANQLLIQHPAPVPGTENLYRRWWSYDGTEGFEVDYWPHDVNQAKTIFRTPDPPRGLVGHGYLAWALGWSIPGSDLDLISLLQRPEAQIVGRDRIGDAECLKVDLGTVSSRGRPVNRITVAIDESARGLPRYISVVSTKWVESRPPAGSALQLDEGEVFQSIEVTAFSSVGAGQLDEDILFPASVEFTGLLGGEIVLDAIRLNERLPIGRFHPETPIGVEIVSGTSTLKPVATVVGGAEGQRVRDELLRQDRARLPPPPSVPATAKPIDASLSETVWMPKLILMLSLACLAAATFVLSRRLRRSG